MNRMKKAEKITIYKVENGFQVTKTYIKESFQDMIYVYNNYKDLIRDMENFLEVEEYEEVEEEERDKIDPTE